MRIPSLLPATITLVASLIAVAAPLVARQGDPPIAELRITVQDLSTKQLRDHVNPGQVLTLEVGDEVRLRMVAIPAERNRAPRYPSTRFAAMAGTGRIRVSRVDEAQGSAVLTAVGTRHPANEQAVTLVSYELLEPVNIRQGLVKGTISIQVVDREPGQQPTPPPSSAAPPAAAGDPELRGVTLYNESNFRGLSETFHYDTRSLVGSRIGQDTARSIRVDSDCSVTLYEHAEYQGTATQVSEDVADLGSTRVGNDRVTSLKVSCEGQSSQRGVTLFTETDFRGEGVRFDRDASRLQSTRIGSDRARSVRVAPGCQAVLYEHEDYRGTSSTLTEDTADLGGLRIGNDRATSLRVVCD